MSTSTASDNQPGTGGNLTTMIVFIIGSIVLAAGLYIFVKYASFVIRVWRSRLHADLIAQGQAPTTLGLQPSDIEAFPTFVYRGASPNGKAGTDVKGTHNGNGKCNGNKKMNGKGIAIDCSICLCDLEENDVVRMLPECRHFYHIQCIDVWLYSHLSCPICRAKLQTESAAFTGCSLSPPLPQFCRYRNLQSSGRSNMPAATEMATAATQIGEITEVGVKHETEMATSVDLVSKRSQCNELSEVQIDIQDEVNTEGKSSMSSKEATSVYHVGSPSQKVPMDEAISVPDNPVLSETSSIKGSPEIRVEVEEVEVQLKIQEKV